MGIWIVTQEKHRILNINSFEIKNVYHGDCNRIEIIGDGKVLGIYKDITRALEIFEEIKTTIIGKILVPREYTDWINDVYVQMEFPLKKERFETIPSIYEMPKE